MPPERQTERPSLLSAEEQEALYRRHVAERAAAIEQLRHRAGFSIADLAKAMGFKRASSIQRYLSPDYTRGIRPEVVHAFRHALIGRGSPPIRDTDLEFLLDWKMPEPGEPKWEFQQIAKSLLEKEKLLSVETESNRIAASLPLLEGTARIELPSHLSVKSAEALRIWFEHLIGLTEDQARLVEKYREAFSDEPPKKK